jgi:hypothetical protein
MKAIFEQDGTLKTLDTTNETFIEGSVGVNNFFAAFENRSWAEYPICTATFKRNDGSVSPELVLTQESFTQNNVTYNGFKINIYDLWFFAIPGKLEVTFRLYSNNSIFAQGKVTISVQKSVTSSTASITPDQYQSLLNYLAGEESNVISLATFFIQTDPEE